MHLSHIVFICATVLTCLALALAWPSSWQLSREPLRCVSTLALGYSACVGYAVALAASRFFACASTKLLGKHSCGSIHPLSWLFMLPYHLGLRVKLGAQRLVSPEPLYDRVLPGWYIGGWPWYGFELPSDGPSVLDCTCELPRTHRNRYLCLPVWDTQAPTEALIERGVAFALAERALGKPVYVHCAHGHGRSALLLIACLLEGGHVASGEEGLALLKAVRPRVHLNGRQRRALEAWARSRGKGGVRMHPLSAATVQRRGSAGGASEGGCGGGDGDVGARVHLLADVRDAMAAPQQQQLCASGPAPHGGLESRLAGLAATAALHGGGGVLALPLGESLRSAGAHLAAAATAAAASLMEGGKKLS